MNRERLTAIENTVNRERLTGVETVKKERHAARDTHGQKRKNNSHRDTQ